MGEESQIISKAIDKILPEIEDNFRANPNKYYHCEINGRDEAYFNPYHCGQWTIFLYKLSYELGHPPVEDHMSMNLADKVYFLNKTISSCDLYHQVEMPRHFSLDHPQGSVMGRAVYGDGFSFCQYSTVGNNKGVYPVIGSDCHMCMNSAIIGHCHIGNNVTIGAGALVKDEDIPNDSLVFGQSPNLIIKKKK